MEAISIEHLSKTYQRGKTKRGDLRRSLAFWWENIKNQREYFNALEDVNLIIPKGEIFGIVGPNGAGKSTLLKILSRITFPTKGRIVINGSLSSLIEVGVGFHPELTGRENIYLNGAIQGMSRKEIDKKFDSIVAFSGLEEFLEMPVKQYSSGMYVRLAFAVSAHLETDILLLDEVMGVGDIEFKKKSIEKLSEKLSEGSTIIMVSHQLDVLKAICTKGIYIREGKVRHTGLIDSVIEYYTQDHDQPASDLSSRKDRTGSGTVRVTDIKLLDEMRNPIPYIQSGQKLIIEVRLESSLHEIRNVVIRMVVFDKMGNPLFLLGNNISNGMIEKCPGNITLECIVPKLPLSEGTYSLNVLLKVNNEKCDFVQNAASFKVEKGDFYPTGRVPHAMYGVLINYNWGIKGT